MNIINNIVIDPSPMRSASETKQFTVFGDPGSVFSMIVTNEDHHFYNFSEELDKNGNVLVEGKDAHTYLDTKEEATEGYAEKTRLGIRYPELLCFISNCFEKRLTDIEARVTTLEG